MSWLGEFAKKIADKIAEGIADNLKKAIGAAVLTLLGAGWLYIWNHFNPLFTYAAQPSSLASHFVGLGQVLNQIDKDSRIYCSGGWDQRIARIGLRSCYRFSFNPTPIYRLYICTHDQRTSQVTTSDQLVALRFFETRFSPLDCLHITPQTQDSYEVVPGKDTQFKTVQFSNAAAEQMAFCGCSDDEQNEIAGVISGTPQ